MHLTQWWGSTKCNGFVNGNLLTERLVLKHHEFVNDAVDIVQKSDVTHHWIQPWNCLHQICAQFNLVGRLERMMLSTSFLNLAVATAADFVKSSPFTNPHQSEP